MFDIIPDIHGQYEKLTQHLAHLGYRLKNGAWRHSNPGRTAVFLGDFIDRGTSNTAVITLVRAMCDAGTGQAIMGNHELNAIMYHTRHPVTGEPLRKHSARNTSQHETFLAEFPLGTAKAADAIYWMKTLPLYRNMGAFRVVHACWDDRRIARLNELTQQGVLTFDDFVDASDETHELYDLVETVTKGPEAPLPEGYAFTDNDGSTRRKVRLKWWNAQGSHWRDIAMSVPDIDDLPPQPAPLHILQGAYNPSAPPVFFGHYWMSGDIIRQGHNAICLDYSAGRDGPLISYLFDGQHREVDLSRISIAA